MTRILAFDTATEACSLALCDAKTVWHRFELAPRQHSAKILHMIDAVLEEANIELSSLDCIAFGHGPGSFMGVRLATSIAQGLGFAHDIPVLGVSTLQVIAQQAYIEQQAKQVIAGWDARMSAIYWGVYAFQKGMMQPVLDKADNDQLNLPQEIIFPKDHGCVAAGNAWEVYKDKFSDLLQAKCTSVIPNIYPRAEAMLIIAKASLDQAKPALEAEPVYLRNDVAS